MGIGLSTMNFHLTNNFQETFVNLLEPLLLNPLNAEFYLICHLLALLGAHLILHVSRIRVNYYTSPKVKSSFNQKVFFLQMVLFWSSFSAC